jgi:hypothetical protein
MLKNLLALLLVSLIAFNCSKSSKTELSSDILGIRIGMSKEDTIKRLQQIGKLDHEERKQQEIWTLNDDPRYSHLILAYDKEKQDVRYITVKAREGGTRVSYSDVIDTNKAKLIKAPNNYKYIQEVPGNDSTPGYSRIASGTDANHLTYFSFKELNLPEEQPK